MAICEPVEVDDDGDQRRINEINAEINAGSTADQRNCTHLREIILLAPRSKQRWQALRGSSLS